MIAVGLFCRKNVPIMRHVSPIRFCLAIRSNTPPTTYGTRWWTIGALRTLVAAVLIMAATPGHAQVATLYTFSQGSGTLNLNTTSGVMLWNGSDDGISQPQTIPAFNFGGTVYTSMYVSTNGFITFGTTAPDYEN